MKRLLWPLLAVVLSACSGLAGEVAIVATLTPSATNIPVVADRGYPANPADLTRGERLYIQHCTACHAVDGSGQGELVLSGQVPAMQSFLDATAMRATTPLEYFEVITNGNLENLMPPWRDALTEQQRWDVTQYVLSMHYTEAQLSQGEQLYALHCADCHGATGEGDGAAQLEVGGRSYNLTYPRDMIFVSDQDLVGAIRLGKGAEMPALGASELSDEEAYAIAAYVRTFSTTRGDPSVDQSTDSGSVNPDAFDIRGQVRNGTTDTLAPAGLTVFLNYGSPAMGVTTLESTVDADGRYEFVGVPRLPESAYFVYTLYGAVTFDAGVQRVEEIGAALDLPITIYESIDNPEVIRLSSMDFAIERFPQLDDEALGNGLLVAQTFTFENTSDRAFILSQAGRNFSVLMVMPPGSIALNAVNDARFIVAQEQFSVIYGMGLPPGETEIELIYFWPYEDGAVFDQVLNYPLVGDVALTVAPKSVTLINGPEWTADTGAPFVNQYTRTVNIARGSSLVFELSGSVLGGTSSSGLVTGDVLLPVLLVLGLAVLAVVGGLMMTRRGTAPSTEALLQQIAQLDALHERGQINHDAYQRQRQELKDRLAVLMAARQSRAGNNTIEQ